jgi:hypothetical protein
MKRPTGLLLAALALTGCATALSKEGAQVRVYGADSSLLSKHSGAVEGCRLLETTSPVLEEESERAAKDPYRKHRDAAGALGGNVLLVFSDVVQRRPSLDCSPRDTSPECLETSQTWYRTSFGYYACAPEAAARLDLEARSQQAPGPIFSLKFKKKSAAPAPAAPSAASTPASVPAAAPAPATAPAPAAPPPPPAAPAGVGATELQKKVLSMMDAGVGVDVIAAWVASLPSRPTLSADDVIEWKKSGIDEKVIRAALAR